MKNYNHAIVSSILYSLSIIVVVLFWIPGIIYSTLFRKIEKLNTKMYYIYVDGKQKGPYSIQKLKSKNINKDTPVYFIGLPEWTSAEYVNELRELTDTLILPITQNERKNIVIPSYLRIKWQIAFDKFLKNTTIFKNVIE